MKLKIMAVLGIVLITFGGCGKQPESRNTLANLPQWYQEPTVLGDRYAASGSAKPNAAGDMELQRIEAAAIARAELARQMELRVKDMYRQASRELGNAEGKMFEREVQYTTKQIADVTLRNSQQKKLFIDSETGILYTLIALDPAFAEQQLKSTIRSSFGNDEAMWQKFQTTQMWKEFERETAQ